MRINLLAFGTRGDVQPAIALGVGLIKAGHSVQVVALEEFRTLVGMYGLDFFPLQARLQAMINPSLAGKVDSGAVVFRLLPDLIRLFRESFRQMTIEFLESSQGADALISNPATGLLTAVVAEKLGVPYIQTSVFPGWPTRAFPSIFWPWPTSVMMSEKSLPAKLRGSFNQLTYLPAVWLVALGLQPMIRRCRTEILGLPRRRGKESNVNPAVLELAAFSEQILPRPVDWGEKIHLTGYWFLDAPSYAPPPALRDFVECGPPPVYVGFGSMPSKDPERALALITRALALADQRAVILTGTGPLGQGMAEQKNSKEIFCINSIPHEWLLPRVAAVVHHGGVGTTAAGIRAGVPGIVVPMMGDQLFWGQRVADLGIGPRPITRKRLSAESLAAAIHQAVSDPAMRQRATFLGKKIRAEDGVGRAVDIIYNYSWTMGDHQASNTLKEKDIMKESVIEVQDFHKTYGKFVAVDNISFDVKQGEIFGLLGPNGAGKTSTLECLEGLRAPNGGSLRVAGMDPAREARKLRNMIGVQLQSGGMPESITPEEAIKFFAAYHDCAPRFDLLERLGLNEKRKAQFFELSTGQQRRLALALAIAHNPKVLFLDEPTAGLDVATRVELHSMMRELQASGTTLILATHDMAEAEQLSDRVAIMLQGRIVKVGTPMEITAAGAGLTKISVRVQGESLSAAEFPAVSQQSIKDEYHIYFSSNIGATISAILARIESKQDALIDLRVERPSLEDRFLEITGAAQ